MKVRELIRLHGRRKCRETIAALTEEEARRPSGFCPAASSTSTTSATSSTTPANST